MLQYQVREFYARGGSRALGEAPYRRLHGSNLDVARRRARGRVPRGDLVSGRAGTASSCVSVPPRRQQSGTRLTQLTASYGHRSRRPSC